MFTRNTMKCGTQLKNFLKLKFTVNPVRDEKYLLATLKIFNGINRIKFTDDQVTMERNHYICIAAIDIDSVLKVDKRSYPQAHLEQCKCKLKKRRPVYFIDLESIDEEDDNDDSDNN